MNATLLNIGDELLIGQVVNTNAAWMGGQLTARGISLQQVQVLPDEAEAIRRMLRRAMDESDVVLLTGGLGPTKDDITKKVLADFFGTELVFSQQVYEHYARLSERFGREVKEEMRRAQSMMPASAVLLHNAMGVAPGMWFEQEGKVVVSMPGVPAEMKYIMEKEALPRLQARMNGELILSRVLCTAVTGEPDVAARLEGFENRLSTNMSLAYLPRLSGVRLRLTARASACSEKEREDLERQLDEGIREVARLLGDVVYALEDISLSEATGRLLREKGLKIVTAESCTGGYLAHLITSVPGSSDYYLGGVVSYANSVKQQVLGVSEETLRKHGAVSEPVVRQMVQGACRLTGADWAMATSGIAGPGGGTAEKPVGTIWIAVGNEKEQHTHLLQLGKNRLSNIQYTAMYALDMLRKVVESGE